MRGDIEVFKVAQIPVIRNCGMDDKTCMVNKKGPTQVGHAPSFRTCKLGNGFAISEILPLAVGGSHLHLDVNMSL